MTFEEFWRALEQKNPDMKEGATMTITVDSFKRSMRQSFEMGQKHPSPNSGGDLLDELLGGFKP